MDLRFLKEEERAENINRIVHSNNYTENIKEASLIFKDRLNSPLKFGGQHLRSHMLDMPWYEVYLLHIAVYFLILVFSIVSVLYVLFHIIWKYFCRQNAMTLKQN